MRILSGAHSTGLSVVSFHSILQTLTLILAIKYGNFAWQFACPATLVILHRIRKYQYLGYYSVLLKIELASYVLDVLHDILNLQKGRGKVRCNNEV